MTSSLDLPSSLSSLDGSTGGARVPPAPQQDASATNNARSYKPMVNTERTILVWLWDDGHVEVATRLIPDHVWGPRMMLTEAVT